MKTLMITLILFLLVFFNGSNSKQRKIYRVTVIQINAPWNKKNSLNIDGLSNCNVSYIECNCDKTHDHMVPIIVVKRGKNVLMSWEGNIMFQPTTNINEIQKYIDGHK